MSNPMSMPYILLSALNFLSSFASNLANQVSRTDARTIEKRKVITA
jgi:hypothetical protein